MANDASATTAAPPRRRWPRRVAIAAATVVALIVLAWLAVPPIVRSQAESRLTEALGRKVTIEKVAFDPFSLELTVTKIAIAEPSGTSTFAACDEIVANLSSASIWHRAPVLDALRFVRPTLALVRDRDGRYSIQDLLDRPARAPDAPPPRFSLNNIEVVDGSVAFDDRVAQRKHVLDKLALGVPFVSSLPYHTEIRVTPRADGALNGSVFALGGHSVPFAERREASIDVDLDALPLAQYVAYLPSRPRFEVAGGTLTTRLKVVFVDGEPGARRLEIRGEARVDALALRRRDGSALVSAERIAAVLDRIDVLGRDARVASVAIDAPSVEVLRRADGSIELAGPWLEPAASRAVGTPAPAEKAWSATLAKATIARGTVKLADAGTSFASTLVDVAVDAQSLSTRAGEKAKVVVAFVTDDRIASFKGEAEVEPLLPAATGRFELAKFSLGLLFPYYKDALALDVQKGSLDLASRFAYSKERGFTLAEGEAAIDDLRLAFPRVREPLWRVPRLVAKGIDVDVAARKVAIGDVQSRGATLRIARERDGTLEAARVMKTTGATGTAAAADRTWTLAVKRLALERVALDVEDRVPDPVVKLAARDVDVVVGDLSNVRGARSTLALRARLGDRGRLAFNGPVVANPFSIDGQLDLANLSLVPLKPYVESRVNVVLTGGSVTAKGRVAVDASAPGAAKASWKGGVTVTDFAALDRPTSSDLARWKTLALDEVDVTTSPFRLSLARIGLDDYYARVIVYPDGTLNLTRLLTPGAAPEPAPDAAPVAKAEREALPIAIGKVDLARGNVNLSDFFVRPNYSANLTDVTGTITATSAERAGDVAIAARVDRTAPVEVRGRIQPFAKELALDLVATAKDVDLPPLTPYSIKYAGYGIEKGKLTFDVHYKVENRKLAAQNRLVLDQLTFNRERVDSPTATKLPVLLAVSLLQDRNGVIDLDLPISGTLDDPQFSMFGIIVQVIVNLIGKAATAPFALLASAFGGGPELSTVPFALGSARIGDEAAKRVDTLAKALVDRPGLKLDIGGRADPAGDRDALVRASVEDAIRQAKMKSLAAAGTAPASLDAVAIAPDERVRWLTAAYRDAPIKERPRNAIGMLQDVPPAQMEALIASQAKVDDDALRRLANARAQAVKDALAAKGVPAERLFLIAPRLGAEGVAAAAGEAARPAPAPVTRVDLALR